MVKRKIAYVNFWKNIGQPINGGTLRAHGLYDALARRHCAELLNYQGYHDKTSMPSSWIVHDLDGELNAWNRSWLRISGLLAGKGIRLTTDALNLLGILKATNYLQGYSDVILTSADFLGAVPLLRLKNKEIRVIYDSHNVDYLLLPEESKERRRTERLERRLPFLVDEVWCCSEVDKLEFLKLNQSFQGKLKVVPNGAFEHQEANRYSGGAFCLGIIGSWTYQPNIEGLEWFLDNVEVGISKSITIKICGTGEMPSRLLSRIASLDRVEFIGRVRHVSEFYNTVSVLGIPLLEGSGTRLKAIEAMSYGVPILSTSKGIEGIELKHGQSSWQCDSPEEWKETLEQAAQDENVVREIGQNAKKVFLENYIWDEIITNAI